METKFSVRGLCAWFGTSQVLHSIDMEIVENSITSIIGPSGCGKSTLIRCLNRMHEMAPNSRIEGEILFDGQSIYSKEVDAVLLRRRIGMVFQKPNPFPSMSIRENVLAGLRLTGQYNSHTASEVLEKALREAALWEDVKDRLKDSGLSLSGGQQQRLCIARALAVEPEVLLMDEPCSALDPIAAARIEDLINGLAQFYTVIIVTHNMQQAARVSGQTAFLLTGELVEFGSTDELFTAPRDKRTENYITGKFG